MEHEIRRKVDLDASVELDNGRVAIMYDVDGLGFSFGVPILGLFQRAKRHRIGFAVVHLAENHGAVARKANVPESQFVRFHFLASILLWPRSPALCVV